MPLALGQLAEGSDGAGSIRVPAAMCGVVGLKPTAGVVPHTQLFKDWSVHGPIARTVSDTALMLDVLANPATNVAPVPMGVNSSYRESLSTHLDGLRVAWSPNLGLGVHVDSEVVAVASRALDVFERRGACVTEAAPDWVDVSHTMWDNIWLPSIAGKLSEYDLDQNPEEFDAPLREIKLEAQNKSLAAWGISHKKRVEVYAAWDSFMKKYDVLVSPTVASATFPLEQFAPSWMDGLSIREQLLDWLFTYPFNMLGNPALTIPVGLTRDERPVGLQIATRHWGEARLLDIGLALEEEGLRIESYPDVTDACSFR